MTLGSADRRREHQTAILHQCSRAPGRALARKIIHLIKVGRHGGLRDPCFSRVRSDTPLYRPQDGPWLPVAEASPGRCLCKFPAFNLFLLRTGWRKVRKATTEPKIASVPFPFGKESNQLNGGACHVKNRQIHSRVVVSRRARQLASRPGFESLRGAPRPRRSEAGAGGSSGC